MRNSVIFGIVTALLAATSHATEPPVETRAVEIGEAASDTLLASLKQELQLAISSKGLVHAIDFCSVNALPLTEEVSAQSLPEGLSIKRTSFKYRNPANAPDPADQKALRFFERGASQGKNLPPFIITKEDDEYRYYRPLKVTSMCLNCHGMESQLQPNVLQQLHKLYPDDKATGYALGDFRGVVRVSIPAQAVE